MKKVLFVLTVLIAACMICSCGGGHGSSGSDSAQKAVAVNFNIDIAGMAAKALTVEDPDYTGLEFWYKASPKWTSEDGFHIQGDTQYNSLKDDNDFVQLPTTFTVSNPTGTVGYFAQGRWEFEIEVRKPIVNSTNSTTTYAVLWKTASPQPAYINAALTAPISITVGKNMASGTGSVKFNVTAPKTSNTDSFVVNYVALGTTDSATPITGLTKGGADDAPTATLTGTASIPSGIYAITVEYYSAASTLVGKSTVAAEIIPGDEVTIGGTIENGKWHQTSFVIKGMYKLTLNVTAGDISDKGTVTVSGTKKVTFTCTPTITNIDGSAVTDTIAYTYEWRINGDKKTGSTDEFEYTLTEDDANSYLYADCIAYFKDSNNTVIGSASRTFRLVVEP